MHYVKKRNLCRLLLGLNEITQSICKESIKISALLTRPDYSSTLQKLPENIQDLLRKMPVDAKPLLHQCRMCIVRRLAPNSHRKVVKLGLPSALQKYLLFRDLDEMLLHLAGRTRRSNNNDFNDDTAENQSNKSDNSDEEYPETSRRKKKMTKRERKRRRKKASHVLYNCPIAAQNKQRDRMCLCTI